MPTFIQPSFAKGELAPALYGRVDTQAYQVGLTLARNAIVHPYGGVSNRPGSVYIGPVKDHLNPPRLFDFQFKIQDQYVLEVGNQYIRFIRNDGNILEGSFSITGVNLTNPIEILVPGHNFVSGDEIFIENVVGTTELNTNRYIVSVVDGTVLRLLDQVTGEPVDGTGFTAWTSGGDVARIFEIVSPWLQEDLPELKAVQNADVMTFTHRLYPPYDLSRTGQTSWTLAIPTFSPSIDEPENVAVAADVAGAVTYRYRVTAIKNDTFEESLPGADDVDITISSATAANPVVATSSAAHGLATGDSVVFSAMDEMIELNGRHFTVTVLSGTTFSLDDEDGLSYTAESTGGIANRDFTEITNGAVLAQNTITWDAVTNAFRYAVYRRENGLYGLIGETELLTYTEDNSTLTLNATPDFTEGPPVDRNPFIASGDYPGCAGYFEQRMVMGGSTDFPDTSYFSQIGSRLNFTVEPPLTHHDAITTTLAARQVNEIRHYVPLNDLLTFTSGQEWRINSGSDSAFSNDTIKQKPQSEWGSSHHKPIVVGSTILYMENGNAKVRSLGYNFQNDSYGGDNLNTFATHFLADEGPDQYIVQDWTWQNSPEPRLYAVRNDGSMLTMTFEQEQKVLAWTLWTTLGSYEYITSLRKSLSDVEDGVYFVVKREINGQTVRFIERMVSRKFSEVSDAFFLDAGASFTGEECDITLISGSGTVSDPTVITAPGCTLVDGDIVTISGVTYECTTDENGVVTCPDGLNGQSVVVRNPSGDTFEIETEEEEVIEGWDLETSVYSGEFFDTTGVPVVNGNPRGLNFNPDGTNMWVLYNNGEIHRYDLATAWDISTATLSSPDQTIDVNSQSSQPRDVLIRQEDGLKMYVLDGFQKLYEYNLTTAWDVSTAVYLQMINLLGTGADSTSCLFFKPDGLKLYINEGNRNVIDEYHLTVPWDISTASGVSTFANPNSTLGIFFKSDGSRFYLNGIGTDNGIQYDLTTPWDITTATNKVTVKLSQQSSAGFDIAFKPDGTKVYYSESSGEVIYARDLDINIVSAPVPTIPATDGILSQCVSTLSGLDYLEGETITVLSEGTVFRTTVVDGKITLPATSCKVIAGIPYVTDIVTLNVEAPEGTIQGMPKKIPRVTVRFHKSRVPLVGPVESMLIEMKQREANMVPQEYPLYDDNVTLGEPPPIYTGDRIIHIKPHWNSNGRIWFRMVDPLPLTILAVIPEIEIGSD